LEKLWATYADGDRYYTPTISKLDNGDFLVTGRMMAKDSMITRVMRTFDFNQDEKLDYIVVWNGNGKFDYDLLNYLASTTSVSQIRSKASRFTSRSDRPRREPHQARSWVTI
jgi:predicted Mrr-cat superfamily restriction endonuclease